MRATRPSLTPPAKRKGIAAYDKLEPVLAKGFVLSSRNCLKGQMGKERS